MFPVLCEVTVVPENEGGMEKKDLILVRDSVASCCVSLVVKEWEFWTKVVAGEGAHSVLTGVVSPSNVSEYVGFGGFFSAIVQSKKD